MQSHWGTFGRETLARSAFPINSLAAVWWLAWKGITADNEEAIPIVQGRGGGCGWRGERKYFSTWWLTDVERERTTGFSGFHFWVMKASRTGNREEQQVWRDVKQLRWGHTEFGRTGQTSGLLIKLLAQEWCQSWGLDSEVATFGEVDKKEKMVRYRRPGSPRSSKDPTATKEEDSKHLEKLRVTDAKSILCFKKQGSQMCFLHNLLSSKSTLNFIQSSSPAVAQQGDPTSRSRGEIPDLCLVRFIPFPF